MFHCWSDCLGHSLVREERALCDTFNPFTADPVKALHFAILV